MRYTVRFAHLAEPSPLVPGQLVVRGAIIGKMGDSGSGTGAHLHLDVVEGRQAGRYSLNDMTLGVQKPAAFQAMLFIDAELFGIEPVITTGYVDPEYYREYKKGHWGFDVVPADRHGSTSHYRIRWNRSMDGTVVSVGQDDPGYGNYVQILFET